MRDLAGDACWSVSTASPAFEITNSPWCQRQSEPLHCNWYHGNDVIARGPSRRIETELMEFTMPSTHHGILIHVVFSTKRRFKILAKDWRDDLYAYMGGIATEHKSTLLRSGGMEDHVHLLLKIHPSFAIADTVKLIKGNSSKWINKNGKINARFEWQRGYGAFSVSESMSDSVKRYIENQEQHHRKQSFKDEYFAFLSKHNIEYNPRYVFDDEHTG